MTGLRSCGAAVGESTGQIVVVEKEPQKAIVGIQYQVNATCARWNMKKEKYQGLKVALESAWKVKASVMPMVNRSVGAETPILEEWLQQISGHLTSLPGIGQILRRTLFLPGLVANLEGKKLAK